MWRRTLARKVFLLLGLQAWAAVASASAPSSSSTARSFHDWLRHLELGVPALNVSLDSLPGGGDLELESGTCTQLAIGGVDVKDLSSGPSLNFAINISGLNARCSLQSAMPLVADVVLSSSWISASMVTSLEFTGDADLVTMLSSNWSAFSAPLKASVNDLLCKQLPDMVNTLGSEALNMASGIASELLFPQPLPPLPQALTPLLDWGTYPPILLGKAMLAERFATWSVDPRTESTFFWEVGAAVLKMHDLGIHVGSVEVAGLRTLEDPGLNLTGDNGTIRAVALAEHLSVTVSTEIDVAPLQKQVPRLVQPVNLTVDFNNLSLIAEVIAMLSRSEFDALRAAQLQMPGCLLECARSATDPPRQSLGVRELQLDMTGFALLLAAPQSLERDLAVAVNRLLGALLRGYLPSLVAVINGLGSFQVPALVDKAWTYLENTSLPCNSTEGTEGVATQGTLQALWGTGLCIVLSGLLLGLVASQLPCSKTAKTQKDNTTVTRSESNGAVDVEGGAVPVPWLSEKSVLALSGVPPGLAIFYPFVVFSVIFLFLFADLALGTSVDLLIEAGGQSLRFGSLFSFSLIGTIRSTWTAGAYAISVLTLLFSGLWPLLKLVLLLVTWLAPLDRIGMHTRGLLLSFLDIWGKFSFLDSWFLVLCMSAFSMQWQGGDAALYVRTRPTVAYFAFLLATMLSLVLGNVASSYHRHAQDAARESDAEVTLANSQHTAAGQRHQRLVGIGVTLLLLLGTVVTMVGATVSSFRFSMSGLGSNLIYEKHHHSEDYSLISVGMAVSASNPGSVGLVLLQVVFLILCVAVPIIMFLALLVFWVVPLDATRQKALLHACRVLDAWATLDVFVLTVAVGHAEFARLASRLLAAGSLAPLCGLVQETLGSACFDLDLELLPGFGMLLAAGILSLVVPKTIQRLCRATPEAECEQPTAKTEASQESRSTSASGGHAFEGNFTRETSTSSGPDPFVPIGSSE